MKRLNHHICTTERCTRQVENKGDICETCKLGRKIQIARPVERLVYNPLRR